MIATANVKRRLLRLKQQNRRSRQRSGAVKQFPDPSDSGREFSSDTDGDGP